MIDRLQTSRLVEAAVVLAVFIAGAAGGAAYHKVFHASGGREVFGQQDFSAAVALACGKGFAEPSASTPQLEQFLAVRVDSFDCSDLGVVARTTFIAPKPAAFVQDRAPELTARNTPYFTQSLYRYLMFVVAMTWKVYGVSWSALSPLFGALYGFTLVAAYGLFRLGMRRPLALGATFAIGISAVHLGHLPGLRDYAKAPFILTLVLLMAYWVRGPLRWKRGLSIAATFGAVLGIGFGFRNDLLIVGPPWLVAVLLGNGRDVGRHLRLKVVCLALSIATFTVTAWPILNAYRSGSNSGHVALLGLLADFDAPLGVAGSIYKWGYGYSDTFASTTITSYTYRQYGRPVSYLSAEYDRAMAEYLARIVRHFPADVLVRAYGSILKVLQFPFEAGHYARALPYGITNASVVSLFAWQTRVLDLLNGWGIWLVAISLACIAFADLRLAAILSAFVAYFTAYPAVQFQSRHFFHLEFIPWWALGFLLQSSSDYWWRQSTRFRALDLKRVGVQILAPAMALAILVIVPLAGLRAYQARHLSGVLEREYITAARVPLEIQEMPSDEGRTLLRLPGLWEDRNQSQSVNTAYVIAEFSAENCDTGQVPVAFRYLPKTPVADAFSYNVDVRVVSGAQNSAVFFPGYNVTGQTELAGIELPTPNLSCLVQISKMAESEQPALLMNLVASPHWRRAKLFQTLAQFETADHGDGEPITRYSHPSKLPIAGSATTRPLTQADGGPVPGLAIASVDGDGWVIRGNPVTSQQYVLQFRPQHLPAGARLVVEGDLRHGALTIGLLKDDRWNGFVNVVTRGPFEATVAVPEAGSYAVVVADFSELQWLDRSLPGLKAAVSRIVPLSPILEGFIKAGWRVAAQASPPTSVR